MIGITDMSARSRTLASACARITNPRQRKSSGASRSHSAVPKKYAAHFSRRGARISASTRSTDCAHAIVDGMNVRDNRVHNYPPRWNGAPSQDLLVIRRNHKTGEVSLDPLRWGLIPYWCEDPKGGRKPINAKCETVRTLPSFREAYRKRRCILPVDGFFEWKAIKGQKAKQPYAIDMKDGSPFGIGGLWENWKDPGRGRRETCCALIRYGCRRRRSAACGDAGCRRASVSSSLRTERWC